MIGLQESFPNVYEKMFYHAYMRSHFSFIALKQFPFKKFSFLTV
jgi:hypothetical protein